MTKITNADVHELRGAAKALIHRSAQLFTPKDKIGTDYPQGVEADRIRARRVEKIADKLEKKMSV